eukprot:TRINITY_DN1058_c0_g1_i2.p1 TRINITY_DN1058_c0_g1~~TRINITY_DN1058_c0_g1_i2.p1  ORF type:complete len:282 (-),score=55.09 TRINITY_DN1058_c0_g1_i2:4-849(-)
MHKKVQDLFSIYLGTHDFHNFTTGREGGQAASKRYITQFEVSKPLVIDGMELIKFSINGQSFLLHQIRKMIGTVVSIVRYNQSEKIILEALRPDRLIHTPVAPGLGLMLKKCLFDNYNLHAEPGAKITYENIQEKLNEFENEVLIPHIIKTEKESKVFLEWAENCHKFPEEEILHGKTKKERNREERASSIVKDEVDVLQQVVVKSEVDVLQQVVKSEVDVLQQVVVKSEVDVLQQVVKSEVDVLQQVIVKSEVDLPHEVKREADLPREVKSESCENKNET